MANKNPVENRIKEMGCVGVKGEPTTLSSHFYSIRAIFFKKLNVSGKGSGLARNISIIDRNLISIR